MTNKEARDHIKEFLNGDEYENPTKDQCEAMELAIWALEIRPTGTWKTEGTGYRGETMTVRTYKCDRCGRRITYHPGHPEKTEEEFLAKYPYCHCGAKMNQEGQTP